MSIINYSHQHFFSLLCSLVEHPQEIVFSLIGRIYRCSKADIPGIYAATNVSGGFHEILGSECGFCLQKH